MEVVQKNKNFYIFRFDRGDDLFGLLQSFCSQNNIKSGWFNAIGSSQELELGYFNLSEKLYETQVFKEVLEIVSISGNLSVKEGELFYHAHGTFSKENMTTLGGHIIKCIVGATCELFFTKGNGNLTRKHNPDIGLHLLVPENE